MAYTVADNQIFTSKDGGDQNRDLKKKESGYLTPKQIYANVDNLPEISNFALLQPIKPKQ